MERKERIGVVLEGGAMRGLFSCGVFDVMLERGIVFDGLVGVSAGAALGCNYKSRQPGRGLRYNIQLCDDWRYCSWHSLLTTGDLIGAEYAYHYVPTHIDIFDFDAFNANPLEFHVVCTDVTTGQAVYQRIDRADSEGLDWIRASASMPLCARVVEIGGRKLLDGGVADSIPLEAAEKMGYGRNVVILTQPYGFRKRPNRLMPLARVLLQRYPRLVEAMAARHVMYNRQLEYVRRAETEGRALVVRPPRPLPIKHITHTPALMQEAYDLGRETALREWERISRFLNF